MTTTKIQRVYRWDGEWSESLRFVSDDGKAYITHFDEWDEMDRSKVLTVTIQPGDLLNNEPRSDHPELDLD